MERCMAKATFGTWSDMALSSLVTEIIRVIIVKKPQSEAEKAGTLRLAAASKAYNELIKDSPEWQVLEQEYLAQRDLPNGKKSFRGYFISKHMKSGI